VINGLCVCVCGLCVQVSAVQTVSHHDQWSVCVCVWSVCAGVSSTDCLSS